jgi:CYTH domain-containing protein
LIAIAELVRARAQATFERIRTEFGGAATLPLFEGVERIVTSLDARARSGVEIERKYLLSALPREMQVVVVKEIEQGYLPGKNLVERLRRVAADGEVRWFRTVKLGAGLVRTELEEACAQSLFEAMWPSTEGKRLTKRRHVVPEGALQWEVDEFTDRALVLAEIELPSADAIPSIPEWLAKYVVREVTDDPAYVNYNLAH